MPVRRRIFEIIQASKGEDRASFIYDIFMMCTIVISLIPLMFKETGRLFACIDLGAAVLFSVDYLLRISTADLKLKRGPVSFLLYPFTPMAIIDLLAILPSFTLFAPGFRLVKVLRLFRTFRVFRSFKILRYSHSMELILDVIKTQRAPLVAVCTLAVGYVLLSALIIFNVEPDTFGNFFDAVYWATISLTTMGYGDIYPVTTTGRIVTMLSSFVGIAIIALPAGIITAGYMDRLNKGL